MLSNCVVLKNFDRFLTKQLPKIPQKNDFFSVCFFFECIMRFQLT